MNAEVQTYSYTEEGTEIILARSREDALEWVASLGTEDDPHELTEVPLDYYRGAYDATHYHDETTPDWKGLVREFLDSDFKATQIWSAYN